MSGSHAARRHELRQRDQEIAGECCVDDPLPRATGHVSADPIPPQRLPLRGRRKISRTPVLDRGLQQIGGERRWRR